MTYSTGQRLSKLEQHKQRRDREFLHLVARKSADIAEIVSKIEASGVDYQSEDVVITVFKAF